MIFLMFIPTILFFLWALFMVLSIIKGAPFIRTNKKKIAQIIALADPKAGDVSVDLGSGDGSILIAFAKSGCIAHGYEINLFLVVWTWFRIYFNGLHGKAFVHWGNMWKVDVRPFSIVTVYGFPNIMKDLEVKLQRELLPGARVVSHSFQFPSWPKAQQDDQIFLYIQ